ncbi:zinc ribbon domain-containing protein, partial [bacterium]
MYCSACGHQNEATSKYCANCGKPLVAGTQGVTSPPPAPSPQEVLEAGRGGLIFTFGILSILLLGPILGIPAWVMG